MAVAPDPDMGDIKDFRDLDVWQRSVELTVEVHRLAKRLPPEETYGLASQLRRAAVSVCANIAEGHGRDSRAEYMRFLRISRGSISEVIALLVVTERLGYASAVDLQQGRQLADRIRAMLTRLIAAVKRSPPR